MDLLYFKLIITQYEVRESSFTQTKKVLGSCPQIFRFTRSFWIVSYHDFFGIPLLFCPCGTFSDPGVWSFRMMTRNFNWSNCRSSVVQISVFSLTWHIHKSIGLSFPLRRKKVTLKSPTFRAINHCATHTAYNHHLHKQYIRSEQNCPLHFFSSKLLWCMF